MTGLRNMWVTAGTEVVATAIVVVMAVMMTNRPLLRRYTQHPKIRRNSEFSHSKCTILTAPYRAEIPFSRSLINIFHY